MINFLKGYLAAGQIAAAAMAANLIALCVAPIITRVYAPADFGAYSTFIALTFVDVVACLGYEKAVLAVRDEEASHQLMTLSLVCAVAFSLVLAVTGLVVLWLSPGLLPNLPVIALLLPVSVLLIGVLNAFFSICVRELRFAVVAVSRIVQALATAAVQLGAATLTLFGTSVGLVLGHVAGAGAAVISVLIARASSRVHMFSAPRDVFKLASEHSSYLVTVVPALLLNSAALQAPILIVGATLDVATTGLFGLTQRIAGAPMGLLGIAVGQVFAGRLSSLVRGGASKREVTVFYLRSAAMMLPVALVLMLVAIPAPQLFALVFGAEWEPAGHIYRSMLPLYCAQMVIGPLQSVFFLVGRHDLYWKAEALRFAMVLLAFAIAASLSMTPADTFMTLGALGALAYAAIGLLAIHALRHARFTSDLGGAAT